MIVFRNTNENKIMFNTWLYVAEHHDLHKQEKLYIHEMWNPTVYDDRGNMEFASSHCPQYSRTRYTECIMANFCYAKASLFFLNI